jgi:hypothetical protein
MVADRALKIEVDRDRAATPTVGLPVGGSAQGNLRDAPDDVVDAPMGLACLP